MRASGVPGRPPGAAGLVLSLVVAFGSTVRADEPSPATDPATGLIIAGGWEQVRGHCAACHSLRLVTQNRGDRAHWEGLLRWMQQQHGLWPLGEAETAILDYLASHYGAPGMNPRRPALRTNWREAEPTDEGG